MILLKLILFLSICFDLVFGLNKARDCKCRIQALNRIVGGKEVSGYVPWMASVVLRNSYDPNGRRQKLIKEINFCGGVVLNEWHILTAGHCLDEAESVGVGNDLILLHYIQQYSRYIGRHELAERYRHPQFAIPDDGGYYKNDLAIIKLKEPLDFSKKYLPSAPACLSINNYQEIKSKFEKPTLITYGYGHKKIVTLNMEKENSTEEIIGSTYLKKINLEDISETTKECKDDGKKLCLKSKVEGESVCYGDSGGPAFYIHEGKSYVVGINADTMYDIFGYERRKNSFKRIFLREITGKPFSKEKEIKKCTGDLSLFTRIKENIDFIKDIVGDDFCSD